jgi:hypothetical protein
MLTYQTSYKCNCCNNLGSVVLQLADVGMPHFAKKNILYIHPISVTIPSWFVTSWHIWWYQWQSQPPFFLCVKKKTLVTPPLSEHRLPRWRYKAQMLPSLSSKKGTVTTIELPSAAERWRCSALGGVNERRNESECLPARHGARKKPSTILSRLHTLPDPDHEPEASHHRGQIPPVLPLPIPSSPTNASNIFLRASPSPGRTSRKRLHIYQTWPGQDRIRPAKGESLVAVAREWGWYQLS